MNAANANNDLDRQFRNYWSRTVLYTFPPSADPLRISYDDAVSERFSYDRDRAHLSCKVAIFKSKAVIREVRTPSGS